MNAVCKGWRSAPRRSPATVSIDLPSQLSASVTQDSLGAPSTSTVQVPQVPCQQPPLTDRSPTPSRSTSSRLAPLSAKVATSSSLWRKRIEGFIGPSRGTRAEQQPAQMDGKNFASPPGAGDGVIHRRGPVGGDREGRRDRISIERAALERALGRLGAQWRSAHRTIGDPSTGNSAARQRQLRCDREDRQALGMDARDLREPEHLGRRPPESHARYERICALATPEEL